jgi:SAM-dependent methyltransferase
MSAEKSGAWLLERMRQLVGLDHYADTKLLDFGCGVRFSQAIINNGLSIGRYVGVDNFPKMIEFLRRNVQDSRFKYIFFDAYHPMYNPQGTALSSDATLPLPVEDFDLACMFSVITHQSPSGSAQIFSLLRRYVKRDGRLFFTCFLDDSISTFEDRSPEQNLGRCFYNREFLTGLVEDCGWQLRVQAPGEGPLIADSFVCKRK